MPWKSRWTLPIEPQSLPSYLFTSPTAPLDDEPLLIDAESPEHYLTQHTYREWSKRFALGLQQAGFKPGDRLLLYSGNTILFPVILMGTIMAGGIFTGANPTYVARELAYQLKDSGATFLITAESSLQTALDAADSIGFSKNSIYVSDEGFSTLRGDPPESVRGLTHFSKLLAPADSATTFTWEDFSSHSEMDRTAVLNYSSGTTGVPKGVEITHMNYISNCLQTEYMAALTPDYSTLVKQARGLSFLPMYHAYGQTHHCVSAAKKGIPVYVMRKFDFVSMLKYIERYRITSLTLVPPIAVALTKRPEVKDYDISSVTSAGCGAAPLGRESAQEFDRKVAKGGWMLRQGWGMTEITCSAIGWDPRIVSEVTSGAVGELNPNIEGMIVDEEGREVKSEERGEFWVRGPNVMKGYWRKPEATAETKTADGWLKTGDIAYMSREEDTALIYIVDRKKELIKVKGNQVAPSSSPSSLTTPPYKTQQSSVSSCQATKLNHSHAKYITNAPHSNGEELPRAYLVLQPDQQNQATNASASSLPKTIAAWLAERVAPHKRLAGGVVIVTDAAGIPKNPSGKILRKLLRERAKEEVGDGPVRESRL
ncbi:hypothetical protein LTR91_012679 [Friedmanniomyces endolithicus]|uniref:AMP-dependent synthetase/ligase domain-containing protein n=1 Tax=Friedmanniomyces endolithicus TaxID=329885 RepID=A0AAN6QQJ2_9PEZI|nr:hypothetical protein LTS09_006548 [Friedmanniomyces endolithicus]KAK0356647.1 hypothetical protein LTR94_003501 [Friedmanniomyces endolithicus]KAK0792637.1 hypothetical protein LTR59_008447 [Friedmanniomyces endolithicus]KAK0794670.1 hypothetical protein LTR38_009167 [Friedmanniomyces endolithicus]KAK0801962.1 hypothetical protein LTR75_008432 [Friedmanniomyces endolithicus]